MPTGVQTMTDEHNTSSATVSAMDRIHSLSAGMLATAKQEIQQYSHKTPSVVYKPSAVVYKPSAVVYEPSIYKPESQQQQQHVSASWNDGDGRMPPSPEVHRSAMLCNVSQAPATTITRLTSSPTTKLASSLTKLTSSLTTVNQSSAIVRVEPGKQMGDRLFVQMAKLKVLIECFEAINEAAGSHEPRAIAFTDKGIYLSVSVPSEGRCHTLNLHDFFCVRYKCISPGFRAIVDLHELIFLLNQIYSTHHGRCFEILDQPDNTLLVHALLDDNKFFDATLKTHVVRTTPEPILQAAYYRYPFLLKVSTDWLHNVFKRLQQRRRSEVIVEFNGETRALEFLSTVEGAPCREGVVIPNTHIIQNPFLPRTSTAVPSTGTPAASVAGLADTHVVYTEGKAVTDVARDSVPEASLPEVSFVTPSTVDSLAAFRYRSQFVSRSIWLAVKRNKIGSFIYVWIAPEQPILFQYVLQRSHGDSRRYVSYDSWIKSVEKAANPHIRMPAGGSAAVARKMLELAPQLGSKEHTFRIGSMAIQSTTGYSPTALDRLKLQDIKEDSSEKNPANKKMGNYGGTNDAEKKSKDESENGFVKPTPKSKSKSRVTALDPDGNPIKKKRGRPPKNPQITQPKPSSTKPKGLTSATLPGSTTSPIVVAGQKSTNVPPPAINPIKNVADIPKSVAKAPLVSTPDPSVAATKSKSKSKSKPTN
jgi:hypothetical protein